MVQPCSKRSKFGSCFPTCLPFLSNLLTTAERILNHLFDELDESSCWACKKFPQSCNIHYELKAGSASRNDDNLSFSASLRVCTSSISPFFVLFSVLWVVAAVLSESAWSPAGWSWCRLVKFRSHYDVMNGNWA